MLHVVAVGFGLCNGGGCGIVQWAELLPTTRAARLGGPATAAGSASIPCRAGLLTRAGWARPRPTRAEPGRLGKHLVTHGRVWSRSAIAARARVRLLPLLCVSTSVRVRRTRRAHGRRDPSLEYVPFRSQVPYLGTPRNTMVRYVIPYHDLLHHTLLAVRGRRRPARRVRA